MNALADVSTVVASRNKEGESFYTKERERKREGESGCLSVHKKEKMRTLVSD
jgi:hypothetical protein